MGAILIVVWLLLVPVGMFVLGYLLSLATGHAFSTGADGDPPPSLTDD